MHEMVRENFKHKAPLSLHAVVRVTLIKKNFIFFLKTLIKKWDCWSSFAVHCLLIECINVLFFFPCYSFTWFRMRYHCNIPYIYYTEKSKKSKTSQNILTFSSGFLSPFGTPRLHRCEVTKIDWYHSLKHKMIAVRRLHLTPVLAQWKHLPREYGE